ncbi:hypothetical protein N9948_01950 [bacterium]|nr:hypothetical protein [bacterium]
MEENKIVLDLVQFMGLLKGSKLKLIQEEGVPDIVLCLDPYEIPLDKEDVINLVEGYWNKT